VGLVPAVVGLKMGTETDAVRALYLAIASEDVGRDSHRFLAAAVYP
jgi:hypothetical protein